MAFYGRWRRPRPSHSTHQSTGARSSLLSMISRFVRWVTRRDYALEKSKDITLLRNRLRLYVQLHSAGKRRAPSACFIAIFPFGLCLLKAVPTIMLGAYRPDIVHPQKRSDKPPGQGRNFGRKHGHFQTFPDILMRAKTAFLLCLQRLANV